MTKNNIKTINSVVMDSTMEIRMMEIEPHTHSKFYVCFDCKYVVLCIPNNYSNQQKIQTFLTEHGNHSIALLNKIQIGKFNSDLEKNLINIKGC